MRLTNLDRDLVYLHEGLSEADDIYFLYRYTPGHEYRDKYNNPLILGVKNDIESCIETAAQNLANSMKEETVFENAMIVPIPTSKITAHRTEKIARLIKQFDEFSNYLVSPILQVKHETRSSHKSSERLSANELQAAWHLQLNQMSLSFAHPDRIVILDDVLNHGTHFRVASDMIEERFPTARISGVVLAITNRTQRGIVVER